MPAGRRRVLLVEDEETISEPLAAALDRDGFETKVVASVAAGLDAFRSEEPDLVLLDLMLPDGSGLDLLRELRSDTRVPVIVLSARGEETDRVVGLELGADDYVAKPFSAREVIARIRAVLRRTELAGAAPAEETLVVGGLRLDPSRRAVTLDGAPVELARKEYELLHVLMAHAGSVLRRERLIEEVWQTTWFGTTKTLDVHVSGLRRKLGDDPADPRFIHTVRGVGFRFAAPDEADDRPR